MIEAREGGQRSSWLLRRLRCAPWYRGRGLEAKGLLNRRWKLVGRGRMEKELFGEEERKDVAVMRCWLARAADVFKGRAWIHQEPHLDCRPPPFAELTYCLPTLDRPAHSPLPLKP